MPVPGAAPPPESTRTELFSVDAYVDRFESRVEAVDADERRVLLERTAFYPGGGGQPHDIGTLRWDDADVAVSRVGRIGGRVWHWLEAEELPRPGVAVEGRLDWSRRHLLMRTHTALHILCGVVWEEFAIPVTGGNMEPGSGRLDFPFEAMSADLGQRLENRINDEIARARDILVQFFARSDADLDPALIRTAANLIPREIDPLRVIDIVGLDRQADGGTHVANTADVGAVRVTGTESKGKGNKRVRIAVVDPSTPPSPLS
jgi:misacylated tRNA(Ala) deacylase